LDQLNAFCLHMMPGAFATVIAARVDLATGGVEAACAGHLKPYVTSSSPHATVAPIRLSPPIGVKGVSYEPSTFTVEPGHGLVLYSDGLVERRGQSIDDGLDRLARTLGRADTAPATWIWTQMASDNIDDDVTVVALRRPSG
jgi:serine phosphatase RsbU (regulator of sigma subunit)